MHRFERYYTILIPRMSAHPPVWALCKVHRSWALFRETTVLQMVQSLAIHNQFILAVKTSRTVFIISELRSEENIINMGISNIKLCAQFIMLFHAGSWTSLTAEK